MVVSIVMLWPATSAEVTRPVTIVAPGMAARFDPDHHGEERENRYEY